MKEIKKIVAAYIDNEMSIKSNSVKDIQFRNARAANDMGFDVIIGSDDEEETPIIQSDSLRSNKEKKEEITDRKQGEDPAILKESEGTTDAKDSINSIFGLKS